ncbi:MAG: hypothetical protein AB7F88_05305 [Pyrinomonadaceae bacterium]
MKFTSFQDALAFIRENPAEYFEEKSLLLFDAFWKGYTSRRGWSEGMRLFMPGGFHDFVDTKYRNDKNHGAVSVVTLYSKNQAEALDTYFELIDEYLSQQREVGNENAIETESVDAAFSELLPALLERPAMYLGRRSFYLLAAFISGWFRAVSDFGIELSDYERRFIDLLKYIEEFDINLLGPTWNSIVWFHTMNDEDAFRLFSEYVEEFVNQQKGTIKCIEYHMNRRLDARNGG